MPWGISAVELIRPQNRDNPPTRTNSSQKDLAEDKKGALSMVKGMKQFYVPISK